MREEHRRCSYRPPPLTSGECLAQCAPDGRALVDCHGEVVTACDAYSTCVGNVCKPSCEVADQEQSSVGCEYFAAKPSAFLFGEEGVKNDGSCYAVMVANTWNAPVELQVEYGGQAIPSSYFRVPRGQGADIHYELLPEGKLPSNEVAILFLAMEPTVPISEEGMPLYVPCPETVGAGVLSSAAVRGSGKGTMFHIRSSAPVTAYDIYPYGGAKSYFPSASLLLPTSSWGTEAVAADGYHTGGEQAARGVGTWFQVLASQDDTHVKIRPTLDLQSVAGAPIVKQGEVGEYLLQRGEFLQFAGVQDADGTGVEADKPVAVAGGASCMNIPEGRPFCDTLHQNIPPIRLFGHEYVATRYRDREPGEPEVTPWLVLAAADDTTLTYDPPIPDAPTKLMRGESKEFFAPGPFVVRTQDDAHPIYVASYMTGGSLVTTNMGDPEMVNVIPVGQYLSKYLFLTDPTYGNTNLVFTRGAVDGKFEDVQLDCLGTVQGWQKVGNSNYEVAYVDLVKNGGPEGDCDNGVHRASSKNPFALTVWGWDITASYGFPAGMGTKTLNTVTGIR
ncbi:hypothetical protein AKJ09_00457 [Labilithrix luteola]|uniref:IgGFc-binding protein N-terminal domain-containing protein n=1 Tax=Labilithrix luteola TaxID=1391654 RepID=A0A0K1PJS9_9BACT|nr:IgGFc-binding protein [Labilithrix luteola]AKU93793.1 hypothetical protein AKJ09_00457 [Labilithrix luteola]